MQTFSLVKVRIRYSVYMPEQQECVTTTLEHILSKLQQLTDIEYDRNENSCICDKQRAIIDVTNAQRRWNVEQLNVQVSHSDEMFDTVYNCSDKCKKLNSLKECLTATRPTSHN